MATIANYPILMSAENPTGHKLEDLLAIIQIELLNKCRKIEAGCTDPFNEHAHAVFTNNKTIVSLLSQAEILQRASLRRLAEIGPDQGPTGKPRI